MVESDCLSENPKLMHRLKDSGSIPPPSSNSLHLNIDVKLCKL